MDSKLKQSISNTLREGLDFIESIVRHLPAEVIQEKNSITKSFQKLLQILNEKRSLQETNSFVNNNGIDERKPINIPPDKTTDDYLAIQKNNSITVPAYTHRPCIRVNVSVNNKLKGLYYCLIEDGVLFLDRNTNAEHSEYVISLGEYTFKAVNDFTIKLTKNELEIALLFSSKIDCDTWMEYLTTARDSVYSYVPICKSNIAAPTQLNSRNYVNTTKCPELPLKCNQSPKLPPKMQLRTQKPISDNPNHLPIVKSKSTENMRIRCIKEFNFVDLSTFNLEENRRAFENRLKSEGINKEINKHLHKPNNNSVKEVFRKVPLKPVNYVPSSRRAHLLPADYQNTLFPDINSAVNNCPLTRSYDNLF